MNMKRAGSLFLPMLVSLDTVSALTPEIVSVPAKHAPLPWQISVIIGVIIVTTIILIIRYYIHRKKLLGHV